MRLRVVYDVESDDGEKKPAIYCEFNPDDFKKVLLEEFKKIHSKGKVDNTEKEVVRCFERTCDRLKYIASEL